MSGGETSVFESDFRILRAAALASLAPDVTHEISGLIPQAGASDYAEWIGWLAPIVDRLVVQPTVEPLEAALAALREPGAMRRTPPVRAQAPGSRPTWRPAPGRTRSRSIDSKRRRG